MRLMTHLTERWHLAKELRGIFLEILEKLLSLLHQ
jgi:hypothetical protein